MNLNQTNLKGDKGALDLSKGAFQQFASLDVGVLQLSWVLSSCNSQPPTAIQGQGQSQSSINPPLAVDATPMTGSGEAFVSTNPPITAQPVKLEVINSALPSTPIAVLNPAQGLLNTITAPSQAVPTHTLVSQSLMTPIQGQTTFVSTIQPTMTPPTSGSNTKPSPNSKTNFRLTNTGYSITSIPLICFFIVPVLLMNL